MGLSSAFHRKRFKHALNILKASDAQPARPSSKSLLKNSPFAKYAKDSDTTPPKQAPPKPAPPKPVAARPKPAAAPPTPVVAPPKPVAA